MSHVDLMAGPPPTRLPEDPAAAELEEAGGAVLSAKGVEGLKRRLAGEAVTQESSGMSKGEWREFEGVWG